MTIERASTADAGLTDARVSDARVSDARTEVRRDASSDVLDASAIARDATVLSPDASRDAGAQARTFRDPGSNPWERVNSADMLNLCRLDPVQVARADQILQAHGIAGVPWAIVRYGRLCYASQADAGPDEAWSTTKTLGALVLGMVSYQTRNAPRTGAKTGPLSDQDRVDSWLDTFSYNKDAHIAHVLAMVGQNADLALGKKTMVYDIIGVDQINSLSDVMNRAIAQDSARLGANLEEFTQRFLFGPLGMKDSVWSSGLPDKVLAYSWNSTVLDMARVGLLMLHDGMWNGQRILAEDYIYRLSHPAFEDANTGYGYLTWLNASSNYTFGTIPGAPSGLQQGSLSPGPCAPVSVFPTHPHGLSDSPDCNYSAPYKCAQQNDVGVYAAVGLEGQAIMVHPGLDMVIAVKNLTPLFIGGTSDFGFGPDTPKIIWDAVVPAVVAGDAKYRGNQDAFCTEYGGNRYAPDYHADELSL